MNLLSSKKISIIILCLLFGTFDANKETKILLVTASRNLEDLKQLVQSMEKDGYFQIITFSSEISLPSSYPEAQEDKNEISKQKVYKGQYATTPPIGTPRILFFDIFFNEEKSIKKGILLHELAHIIINESGKLDDLYRKAESIKELAAQSLDKRKEIIIVQIANIEMGKILALPSEILAEKWLYKNYSDLFFIRISYYFEWDKKNLKELKYNITSNKEERFVLQKIINRILTMKSIYSFYDADIKTEHLALMMKFEDYIKQISNRYGFDSNFIFEYIDKIIFECTRKEINSERLIELFLSYRKDFLKNVFNAHIEK